MKKPSLPLLRLGHPLAFARFLRVVGAPAERYLRSAKLPQLCDDPDEFVPLTRAWSFFDAAARNNDTALGWRVAAFVGDHSLNTAFLRKLELCPTLYDALHTFVQLSKSEATHLRIGLLELRDCVRLYTCYPGMRAVPGYQISQAYQIPLLIAVVRYFLGTTWMPEEIGIEHSIEPRVANELFPGTRFLTHRTSGYIAIPRARLHWGPCADAPQAPPNGELVPAQDFDFVDALRALLKTYLPDGYQSASSAADLMGTSERSLARILAARKTTYGKLIDEVRFMRAKQLLRHPELKIADVALSVGFSDQRNFARSFCRLAGMTPRAFRKAAVHSSGAHA